jgi:hypothetical protein
LKSKGKSQKAKGKSGKRKASPHFIKKKSADRQLRLFAFCNLPFAF